MALLQPSEYDASYFDGRYQTTRHNAGYATYERWFYNQTNNFEKRSLDILNRYTVGNKSVLEICCAKGFVVEDLVANGLDAYGVDVSSYAISEASLSIADRLTVADIRIGQSTFLEDFRNNEFALILGFNCLCCFSDAEISAMVIELNRISSDQFYMIAENANASFYNPKTIQEWRDGFAWEQGTVFFKASSQLVENPQVNIDYVVK